MSSDRFTPHQKLIIQRAILFAEMIRELFLLFVPPYVGCRLYLKYSLENRHLYEIDKITVVPLLFYFSLLCLKPEYPPVVNQYSQVPSLAVNQVLRSNKPLPDGVP